MKFKLSLIILFVFSLTVFAQEKDMSHETNSSIPELSDFHDIIYPIWHTAYPEKDYAALRSYKEEVNTKAEKIFAVNLPGILREKQAKWDEGLKEFKKTVDGYNSAVAGTDDKALMDAAENLHSKYEMLVRVIRPVLKEVDAFHQVLYVVYHKDLPAKDFKAISEKSGEFVTKAEAITHAKLSKRMESRTEKFNAASVDLLTAAKALDKVCKEKKDEGIGSAVEVMHTKYQALEAVFE